MKTVKYFRKKLHLQCSTGFCMYPWNLLTFCNFFIALKKNQNIALKHISDSEHVYFQVSILESLLPAISDRNTSECKSDRIRDATSFCPVCGRTSWISKNISIIDIITIIVTDIIRIYYIAIILGEIINIFIIFKSVHKRLCVFHFHHLLYKYIYQNNKNSKNR